MCCIIRIESTQGRQGFCQYSYRLHRGMMHMGNNWKCMSKSGPFSVFMGSVETSWWGCNLTLNFQGGAHILCLGRHRSATKCSMHNHFISHLVTAPHTCRWELSNKLQLVCALHFLYSGFYASRQLLSSSLPNKAVWFGGTLFCPVLRVLALPPTYRNRPYTSLILQVLFFFCCNIFDDSCSHLVFLCNSFYFFGSWFVAFFASDVIVFICLLACLPIFLEWLLMSNCCVCCFLEGQSSWAYPHWTPSGHQDSESQKNTVNGHGRERCCCLCSCIVDSTLAIPELRPCKRE